MQAEKTMGRDYTALGGVGAVMMAQEGSKRQPEVRGAVERLDRRMSNLAEALEMLDDRLTGYIARPAAPVSNSSGQIKGAMATGLGQQLDAVTDAIDAMTNRIQGLMERLET